jgi:hypothetical protein
MFLPGILYSVQPPGPINCAQTKNIQIFFFVGAQSSYTAIYTLYNPY